MKLKYNPKINLRKSLTISKDIYMDIILDSKIFNIKFNKLLNLIINIYISNKQNKHIKFNSKDNNSNKNIKYLINPKNIKFNFTLNIETEQNLYTYINNQKIDILEISVLFKNILNHFYSFKRYDREIILFYEN